MSNVRFVFGLVLLVTPVFGSREHNLSANVMVAASSLRCSQSDGGEISSSRRVQDVSVATFEPRHSLFGFDFQYFLVVNLDRFCLDFLDVWIDVFHVLALPRR